MDWRRCLALRGSGLVDAKWRTRHALIVGIAAAGLVADLGLAAPNDGRVFTTNGNAEQGTIAGWQSGGWGAVMYSSLRSVRVPYRSGGGSSNQWLFSSSTSSPRSCAIVAGCGSGSDKPSCSNVSSARPPRTSATLLL